MNILIPHTWLKDHLETEATPTELQRIVSLSGPSIERIYDREGDSVYDIEVTTNRVDSMSVRGIAREAAVILQQAGVPAKLKTLQLNKVLSFDESKALPLPKISNQTGLSQRILAIVLSSVKRAETPDWMASRLKMTDQNIHDAVIDITNYITHDLGHPCHAFDYDKIMKLGGVIKIVEASAGKTFTTLDGATYTTVGGEVVFENEGGEIIDLPAIKGTLNTSIDESTQNVLFWIESINAKKVRFASMTHAIRTVAAQLNEKNVDPDLALSVFERGVELYQTLCGATIASPLYDEYPGKSQRETITLELSQLERYLGLSLPMATVEDILKALECEVTLNSDKTQLTVQPPSFRPDLEIPADIVEEIARIYGYHNLPSVLMPTAIPLQRPDNVNFAVETKLKRFLSALGWQEIYSYSMVSEAIALESGFSLAEHLKLQNPLTDDRVYLRRSLVPSLLEVLKHNPAPTKQVRSLFELAHVYQPQPSALPLQTLQLTMVSELEYRQARGMLEALMDHLFVKNLSLSQDSLQQTKATISALNHQQHIVEVGSVYVTVSGLTVIELNMSSLLTVVNTHPEYQPQPKTALIREDLTFTLPATQLVGPLLKTIKELSPLIRSVHVASSYQQNVSFSLEYHDPEQNITVETIEPLRKQIVTAIQDRYQAMLVGSL